MKSACWTLVMAGVLLSWTSAGGQHNLRSDFSWEPLPEVAKPLPVPEAVAKHRQAVRLFLQAKLHEKEMRLADAARLYGQAAALEPEEIPIRKALIPVCLSLDQVVEAMEHCRAVLEREPNETDVLLRYAGALEECKQPAAAADALQRALATPSLRDRPVLRAQIGFKVGGLREDLKQFDASLAAFAEVVATLEALEREGGGPDVDPMQVRRDLAKTHERLASVATQAQRWDQAVASYEKAAQLDPAKAPRMEFHLAQVHLARRDPARALAHLQRYVATRPGGIEAYETLAHVLRDLGKVNDILPALEEARRQDPFNQALRFFHAGQLAEVGRFREAERIYLAALDEFPSEEATQGLLHLYDRQGRWTDVVKRLDATLSDPRQLPAARAIVRILDDEPELAKSVVRAASALPHRGAHLAHQTRRVLTTLARQSGMLDLAEHFCRTCVADDPQPGDAYLELCRILSAAEKYEAEAAVCREALTKELRVPAHVFRLELVRALGLLDRHDEAIAAAEEARKLAATSEEEYQAAYHLAVAQYRAHRTDKALAIGQQLLAQIGDDLSRQRQLHYFLASIHGARKEHDLSVHHLQSVLDIDPDDATACNDLGYLWADQCKNLDEAERLIRKALELDRVARGKRGKTLEKHRPDEDNAAYVDSLGWVLYRRGRLEEARRELERASQLPDGAKDATVWEHLGQVYGDLGMTTEARAAYDRALQLLASAKRPDAPERRLEVQRLRQALKDPATARP